MRSITAPRHSLKRSVGVAEQAAVKDLEACIVLSIERSDRARPACFHHILRVVEP